MTTETVTDVLRDFDAMAAECGGLEAATIHAMTLRVNAAHAREVERAVANERVRDVHTCHDQCTKTELCRMTRRAEAAEADARRFAWWMSYDVKPISLDEFKAMAARKATLDELRAAIDAAMASGGEG